MAKLGKKTKTLRYEWIFGDRESLIPKKISKKFEFKAKTGPKMTKNKTILSQNWAKHRDNIKKNKSKIAQNHKTLF